MSDMSHSTNESEDGLSPKDQMESSFVSDCKSGGGSRGVVLKKGPWTSAEDAILIDYVKKHGEGNWNAVQKHSGLFRCGKSCRLRWANHLRPNLKKGTFTPEEEQLIIELHAKMGNKWARMAAHLPGRTDNEIKNYWNTRIKRRQRAGLPLYPPEVCLQALQESQCTSAINGDGKGGHDLLQPSSYEIPDVVFDSLKGSPGILRYGPELSDISGSSMLMKGLGTQYCSFMPPVMHAPKRMRESTSFLPVYNGGIKHESPFDQFQDSNMPDKIARSFGLSFPTDPDPMTRNLESLGVILGSHSLSNGNFSASGPALAAVKLELPSLQYQESELGGWATSSSPPPLLDSVDGFIQSPPPTGRVESDCLSPRNSGLLDALLHEAKILSSAKNQSFEKSSNSSAPGDVTESSTWNIGETEWENYSDPISPVGHSATSLFSECTPISASGSSLEDPLPTETRAGRSVKSEQNDPVWMAETRKETPLHVETSCPDAMLASSWVEQCGGGNRDQGMVRDGGIASLLGDDLGSEYKSMGGGASSSHGQGEGWGLGSCAWNNMPAVCQMSELP